MTAPASMSKSSLLALLLGGVVLLSGCAESGADSREPAPPEEVQAASLSAEPGEKTGTESAEVGVEEQVVFDADGIRVTVQSLNHDGLSGPALAVLIENGSDDPITVQARDSAVNGVMVDTTISCDVQPGKEAGGKIKFSGSHLRRAGVAVIHELEFKLYVINSTTGDRTLSDAILVSTNADASETQTFDDSGVELVDEEGVRIVCQRLDSEDSLWGADIVLYAENNTGDDITIQIRDCSVNGRMISPIFSCDILDGKRAYHSVKFLESDLTGNSISSIEEMECSFHIIYASGGAALDTEHITITF